jgi:protein-ribulosamine 3-kinase
MKATPFSKHLQEELSKIVGEKIKIISAIPAHGGSINECFFIETDQKMFFLKRNIAENFPGMFEAEVKGLHLLTNSPENIIIPEAILQGTFKEHSYLVIEFFEKTSPEGDFWENFGRGIAGMHAHHGAEYGLDHDNYIGSLKQKNSPRRSWFEFFIHERLEPQAILALTNKKISRNLFDRFQKLYRKIETIFPVELPALLHGDLWSGNFLCTTNNKAVLYDPAVYYGHREMDLAMSKLFGGFNQKFYSAYNEIFPLEKEWEKRTEICNLYPLLVHVNLFGGGYLAQIDATLKKFE